jgi:predicted adenylyl cyclase CyaB
MAKQKLEQYLTRQFEKQVARTTVEIEQKYRVSDVDGLRKRLIKLGARRSTKGYERNELFDMDGALRRQGRKLRLRRHGEDKAVLTLKGPRQGGIHKTRMEIETRVDYEPAKRILELLSFRVSETYGKLREEYKLGPCTVCLDHIAQCGWFFEIEGTPKQINEIARKLELNDLDREHRSYRKLIKQQLLGPPILPLGAQPRTRAGRRAK